MWIVIGILGNMDGYIHKVLTVGFSGIVDTVWDVGRDDARQIGRWLKLAESRDD